MVCVVFPFISSRAVHRCTCSGWTVRAIFPTKELAGSESFDAPTDQVEKLLWLASQKERKIRPAGCCRAFHWGLEAHTTNNMVSQRAAMQTTQAARWGWSVPLAQDTVPHPTTCNFQGRCLGLIQMDSTNTTGNTNGQNGQDQNRNPPTCHKGETDPTHDGHQILNAFSEFGSHPPSVEITSRLYL